MINSISDLKQYLLDNKGMKEVKEVNCECEVCGKSFILHKRTLKKKLASGHLYCKGCQISITKISKPVEVRQEEQRKREETYLKRYGCKTKITFPESREAWKKMDWEARNKKIIETKKRNGTLNRHGLGLKDPEVRKKTIETFKKNHNGASNNFVLIGKERSLKAYERVSKALKDYSTLLNDKNTFKLTNNKKRTTLHYRCKKCGNEYSGSFISEFRRCPLCYPEDWPGSNASHGEDIIKRVLEERNIPFESQKSFEGLRGNYRPLRFDFYVPQYNTCIEYQGNHHYYPLEKTEKGKANFDLAKEYDRRKKKYCETHNIKLLEIKSYEEAKKVVERLELL